MSISLESFAGVLRRSRLLDDAAYKKLAADFRDSARNQSADSFARFLVEQQAITAWQGAKLLQGKHKGFFLGKYRLLSLLGKGGMSSVYLAEHVVMKRLTAIKVLPWKLVKEASYVERFQREAQAVAALDHPNIVRAYDIDHQLDGNLEIHFLVMEYVNGSNLFDLVQSSGPLSPVRAAEYLRQGALGLDHAHRAGMVHRDIKPGNFIVDSYGVVKLMDLGLARVIQEGEDLSLTVRHEEKVIGTADYLAPEQAIDSHTVDHRADIYSLGCTFYFLLTGRAPFLEGNFTQRLLDHQLKEPTPIEQIRQDVPASLLAIIRSMMAKQREERIQSAGDVVNQLTDWLSENGGAEWEALSLRSASATLFPVTESGRYRLGLQGGFDPESSSSVRTQDTAWDSAMTPPSDTDAIQASQPSTIRMERAATSPTLEEAAHVWLDQDLADQLESESSAIRRPDRTELRARRLRHWSIGIAVAVALLGSLFAAAWYWGG
ncbi:serine/threonine-protein kinase [Planctomicrobium sp. SH664]|uniref:serine/threonine-protein kinase n=1 Tax=Planctomicrobium sp. SH664 TaxID=3448125 RepID=UPI003F5C0A91